jgi:alpha-glucosidase
MTQRAQVLSPNVKPGLLTPHPLHKEFDAMGAFIREQDGSQSKIEKFWGGDASFVDFTNQRLESCGVSI